MCLNLVKIIIHYIIMNNGPNLVSLCIIGGVAGASMFGLYLGYKALFDKYNDEEDSETKGQLKKNLSELLSMLPTSDFDVAKTLNNHKKGIIAKGERTKLRNPTINKSSENKDKETANRVDKFVEKATSIINKTEKKIGIVEVDTKADMKDNIPEKLSEPRLSMSRERLVRSNSLSRERLVRSNSLSRERLVRSNSLSDIIKKNDELPLVMNKKRLSESNEEIETLLELPGMDNNAAHAGLLLDEESIRTIDKTNLKRKKRNKKNKKESTKKD
jgi:hypothetical protein